MTNYFARKRMDIERNMEIAQPLIEHLQNTADLAADFANAFNSEDWGRFCGFWHDLGKYSKEFQKRLCGGPKVDHSLAGAVEALNALEQKQLKVSIIGQIISGHHTGLSNGSSDEGGSAFLSRLDNKSKIPNYNAWKNELPALDAPAKDTLRFLKRHDDKSTAFAFSFWGRMIFSALVDADFLDTERFMSPEKFALRGQYPALEALRERFEEFMGQKMSQAPKSKININEQRREIYEAALAKAKESPGFFSLTVPTGGGKTLSSLAFALRHAQAHRLRRIIYVIPFTSIIEQTAAVFRDLLGGDLAGAVLEHHSNMLEAESGAESEEADNQQINGHSLAIENWDAPLVVTTSVQFFESLFAARSSQCRKLHNIAGSVIIVDECQTLPPGLLQPTQAALKELVATYGCSIVLCTATQPELAKKNWNPWGLEDVREIGPDAPKLFTVLKRVKTEHLGECEMDDLATRLEAEPQALAILDTKAQAAQLAMKLKDSASPTFHLSTNMCPAHRRTILTRIKGELAAGNQLSLVSTSLIEAGVDIDFPAVYRALSGLDSVAQAAGRCNREGRMEGLGITYTFILPGKLQGDRHNRRVICQDLIKQDFDLLSPEAAALYFNRLYTLGNLDSEDILRDIAQESRRFLFPYRTVARKYKFIEDDGRQPLLIPFDDKAREAFETLRYGGGDRNFYRSLGQWIVNIRPQDFKALRQSGAALPVDRAGIWYGLANDSVYHELVGLRVDDPYFMEIDKSII